MKKYLLLTLIFALSASIYSCQETEPKKEENTELSTAESKEKTCMQAIITADNELGEIRNHACEKQSLSQTINDYIASLESLDFTDCPSAFEAAFDTHIEAWRDMLSVTDKYPDMRGELHALLGKIENGADGEKMKELTKALFDTFMEVEKLMSS